MTNGGSALDTTIIRRQVYSTEVSANSSANENHETLHLERIVCPTLLCNLAGSLARWPDQSHTRPSAPRRLVDAHLLLDCPPAYPLVSSKHLFIAFARVRCGHRLRLALLRLVIQPIDMST